MFETRKFVMAILHGETRIKLVKNGWSIQALYLSWYCAQNQRNTLWIDITTEIYALWIDITTEIYVCGKSLRQKYTFCG